MEREIELSLSAIEDIMKQCNTNKRNIAESVEKLKIQFPQDVLIIEEEFLKLCHKYDYDPIDFTTAKKVQTK